MSFAHDVIVIGAAAALVVVAVRWRARHARRSVATPAGPRRELCDVRSLVETVVDRAQVHARDRQAEIDFDPAVDFSIIADRAGLVRVLTAFLRHGLDRVRPGDSVRVTARRAHGHASFSVVDTGPEIAPAKIAHMFERFHPDSPPTDELHECRAIVEAHRGRVGAFAGSDGGCTTWFTIPAARELA